MAERLDWKAGLFAAVAVYAGAQLTVAQLIADGIDDVGQALTPALAGSQDVTTIPQVGSDACTLLAGTGLRRQAAWLAFPVAGRAADRWRAQYHFEAQGGCRRGRNNTLLASRVAG